MLFARFRHCRRYRHRVWLENLQCHASYTVSEEPHELDGERRSRIHVVWKSDDSILDAFRAHHDTDATPSEGRVPRDEPEVSSEVREGRARKSSS